MPVKYVPFVIWLGVTAPRPGWDWSMPVTVRAVKLTPLPPNPPNPPPPFWPKPCRDGLNLTLGAVPEMSVSVSVREPATAATPAKCEILAASEPGNESWLVARNVSEWNFWPGFRLRKLSPGPPPACWRSRAR